MAYRRQYIASERLVKRKDPMVNGEMEANCRYQHAYTAL